MMRRWRGAVAALAVGGCAFSSETPLFDPAFAAFPFNDGARFVWREHPDNPEEEVIDVTYHRRASGYEVVANKRGERPMEVAFFALPDTPEEDYIAQVAFDAEDTARVYSFLWRSGDRYKMLAAPGPFEEYEEGVHALAQLCAAGPNGECQFASRADALDFYRRAVYPNFVAPDSDWHGLGYQIPVNDGAAEVTPVAKPGKG